MKLRVRWYGEPILRENAEAVTVFDAELKELAKNMIETMYASEGIGLAAQQIGEKRRICVMDLGPNYFSEEDFFHQLDGKAIPLTILFPLVLVNPKITEFSEEETVVNEGCLSIPDMRGPVFRPERVVLTFEDLEGHKHGLKCNGAFARCIQHEIDHLNGVLYIDRMEPRELDKLKTKLTKLKRLTRERLKEEREGR